MFIILFAWMGVKTRCKKESLVMPQTNMLMQKRLLQYADDVIMLDGKLNKQGYQNRNFYMVDNTSLCVAYDVVSSKTSRTVEYTIEKGLEVVQVVG